MEPLQSFAPAQSTCQIPMVCATPTEAVADHTAVAKPMVPMDQDRMALSHMTRKSVTIITLAPQDHKALRSIGTTAAYAAAGTVIVAVVGAGIGKGLGETSLPIWRSQNVKFGIVVGAMLGTAVGAVGGTVTGIVRSFQKYGGSHGS